MNPKRLFAFSPRLSDEYDANSHEDARVVVSEDEANLVTSATDHFGVHMPVIDLDVPAQLVPSSTPGHSHLYIDVPMSWKEYQDLLDALVRVGIVEPGYVGASKARGASFVRKPGVKKPFSFQKGDRVQVARNEPGRLVIDIGTTGVVQKAYPDGADVRLDGQGGLALYFSNSELVRG